MNKKGLLPDIMVFLTGFFILAIGIIAIYYISDSMNDAFLADDTLTNESLEPFQNMNSKFPSVFDWMFVTIFFGLVIGAIALSYIIPANPAYFMIMLLLTLLIGGVGGFLSNAWGDVTETGVLADASSSFPMMNFILDNFLMFIVVIFILMTVVFFAKPEGAF